MVAVAASLCAGDAAADIVPSEALISATPAPWDTRDPNAPLDKIEPSEPAPATEEVVLLDVTASIDLFPASAIVRSSVVLQGPAGGLRRVGIPQYTRGVRAAPITDLAVLVDGRPVTPELIETPRPAKMGKRGQRIEGWWVWPVAFASEAPVRIEMSHTQVLSSPELWEGRLHAYAIHTIGEAARWQGPIRSVEVSLRPHGIPGDGIKPGSPPTTDTAEGSVWPRKDVVADREILGVVLDIEPGSLPGRDTMRAPYFPADAPGHFAVQDQVVRFALTCAIPTPAEWEQLIESLRETAVGSTDPLARSWAGGILHELSAWCFVPREYEEGDEVSADPEGDRCKEWIDVADPGPGPWSETLRWTLPCWRDVDEPQINLRLAASRRAWRRIGWGTGLSALVIGAAAGLWIRRRRRAGPRT